jgi:Tfp pilus assembly protein PilN
MKKIINLLPEERKKALLVDKFNKFIVKIGLIFIFAIFIFLSFLGSVFFILNFYQKINIIEYNQNEMGRKENLAQEAKKLAEEQNLKTTEFVKKIESRIPYWDYLNDINGILPEDVYYSKLEIDRSHIKLRGLSLSRDTLIEFRKLLEENKHFKKVEMPISNFTSPENINFEIDIELNNKE